MTYFVKYKGKEYNSHADLCRELGIKYSSFERRMNAGLSVEDAVNKALNPTVTKVYDHLGNEFSSRNKMCEYYGITLQQLKYRLDKGMTLEKALTKQFLRDGFR